MRTNRLKKKKPDTEYRSTVKSIHDKKITDFLDYYKTLPKKEKDLENFKNKYNRMNSKDYSIITERISLNDIIISLEKEINDIKSQKELSNYLLNAQQILLKIALSSDKINENVAPQPKETNILSRMVKIKGTDKKGSLMEEYLIKTGQSVAKSKNLEEDFLCKTCNLNMFANTIESILSCTKCGICRTYVDVSKPQWSDTVEIITPYSYRRHNHFEVHLRRVQGKETKSIPQEIIDKILIELKKEKIIDKPKLITEKKIRSILKKLQLNKYYNNIHSIIYILINKKPPKMSKELEDKLRMMFNLIQEPFEKFKSKTLGPKSGRSNFLSYKYTINKFLRILGENDPKLLDLLQYFPLLKSREKLIEQDRIWRMVCENLRWSYHSSV
jgi:transcription elongation factor Elf1